MTYILIDEVLETPTGFETMEAIVRIVTYNKSTSISNTDAESSTTYSQSSLYKSLVDFQEGKSPIVVDGFPLSHSYPGAPTVDELYDLIAASLVASGYNALVQETI